MTGMRPGILIVGLSVAIINSENEATSDEGQQYSSPHHFVNSLVKLTFFQVAIFEKSRHPPGCFAGSPIRPVGWEHRAEGKRSKATACSTYIYT